MIIMIIFVLLLHFFADFVLQTHDDAMNKSTSVKHLFSHVWEYSVFTTLVMLAFAYGLGGVALLGHAYLFGAITFVSHFSIDYVTSKWNSRLWKSGNVHDFFVGIGYDPWLHAVQLILTYVLIFGT